MVCLRPGIDSRDIRASGDASQSAAPGEGDVHDHRRKSRCL